MKLIKIETKEEMPNTLFTAEELSTFIRKSILVFVVITLINGVVLFVSNYVQSKSNKDLQIKIEANQAAAIALTNTVTTDIQADAKWREEFGRINPKAVLPKVIQPTPPPIPREIKTLVPEPTVAPAVIVVPAAPVVKTEYHTRTKKVYVTPKPKSTPWRPPWWKKSR